MRIPTILLIFILVGCSTSPRKFQTIETPLPLPIPAHSEMVKHLSNTAKKQTLPNIPNWDDSANLWSKLQSIHTTVQRIFVYTTDEDRYTQEDYWAVPSEDISIDSNIYGDCEDFALVVQALCEKYGIYNSRLVACRVSSGRSHCVLEVDGYILDSTKYRVERSSRLNYQWVKLLGYDNIWKFIQ